MINSSQSVVVATPVVFAPVLERNPCPDLIPIAFRYSVLELSTGSGIQSSLRADATPFVPKQIISNTSQIASLSSLRADAKPFIPAEKETNPIAQNETPAASSNDQNKTENSDEESSSSSVIISDDESVNGSVIIDD